MILDETDIEIVADNDAPALIVELFLFHDTVIYVGAEVGLQLVALPVIVTGELPIFFR